MKILYISQYFHPEIGATTNRALANVRCFANKGHDVTVLSEIPNHPKGIIFDGYKRRLFMKEKMEDFMIHRVWVYTNKKKNFITRLLFYLSFMFLGTIHTIFSWKKYDVIYVTSPPLFVGVIGLWLKKIFKKTKFIFEVRDLWPDSAVELGELKNRIFIKLSQKVEKKIYDISEHIVVVTEYMKNKIITKGYDENKISIVYNGTDYEFMTRDMDEKLEQFTSLKEEGKFICIYAGIIGIAQGLELMLKVAKKLSDDEVELFLVGVGPELEKLKKMANSMNLKNLHFIGQVARNKIHLYLANADLGIIPLRKMELFKGALPSKIFDYLVCNLPILLGIKGEAAKILKESKAGITYKPDNSEDLAEKILYLKSNPEKLNEMASRGRFFVEEKFNRQKMASKLEKKLVKLLEQ